MANIEGSTVSIYNEGTEYPESLRAVLDRDGIRDLPIVIIPVAGEYRGGKSFLLSHFLRYLTNQGFGDENETLVGFDHARSTLPVTQGINIWNRPVIVNRSGQRIVVLLMDSQGILGRQDNNIAQGVFALSTILSSIMIFNLKCQINEGVWNYLQLFTSYANQLTGDNISGAPFQKLMILIRDWQNSDVYGYQGGEEYLVEYFNNDENAFHRYFEDNSCFLMPHPGPIVMNQNYNGSLRELSTGFKQYIKQLIMDFCNPDHLAKYVKNVEGNSITAGQFCDYFEKCTILMNKEDWTRETNIVKMNAEFTCEMAKKEALCVYTSYMDKETRPFILRVTDSSFEDLKTYNRNGIEKAKRKFEESAAHTRRNEPQIFDEQMQNLNEELNAKYDSYQEDLRRMMLQQTIFTMKESVRLFETIDNALEQIVDEMTNVQTGVRVTKWITTAVGVGSAIALFTPLAPAAAPVAAATLGAAGAGGVAASATDFILTKGALDKIKAYAIQAEDYLKQCIGIIEQFGTHMIGVGAGIDIALVSLTAVDDLTRAGMAAVSTAGKVFAGLSAAIGVVDAVVTQVTENASIETARNLQEQIKGAVRNLNTQIDVMKSSLQIDVLKSSL